MRTYPLLLAFSLLALVIPPSFETGSTTVTAPIDNRPNMPVGKTFNSAYYITNSRNAYGWQVTVSFDPTHIKVQTITVFSPWRSQFHITPWNNTAGRFSIAVSYTDSSNGYSNAGSVLSFQITFRVLKAHSLSTYHIVSVSENAGLGTMFVDRSLNQASLTLVDGEFCNLVSCS